MSRSVSSNYKEAENWLLGVQDDNVRRQLEAALTEDSAPQPEADSAPHVVHTGHPSAAALILSMAVFGSPRVAFDDARRDKPVVNIMTDSATVVQFRFDSFRYWYRLPGQPAVATRWFPCAPMTVDELAVLFQFIKKG